MGLTNPKPNRYNTIMEQLTTLQDVHNHITDHLIKQGKPARSPSTYDAPALCKYRGPENTSCAVGCLISDDNYTEELEGVGISHSTRGYRIMEAVRSSINWEGDDTELLELLESWQNLHDSFNGAVLIGSEKRTWDVYIKEESVRIAERYTLAS